MSKYVHLLYLSIAVLAFDCFYFIYFIFKQTKMNMVICIILVLIFAVLFSVSSKNSKYDDGYNVIHAAVFFRKCRKAGIKTIKDFREKKETAKRIAQKSESSKALNDTQLAKMFVIGKDYVEKQIIANK